MQAATVANFLKSCLQDDRNERRIYLNAMCIIFSLSQSDKSTDSTLLVELYMKYMIVCPDKLDDLCQYFMGKLTPKEYKVCG